MAHKPSSLRYKLNNQASFRLIHRNTVQASVNILEKANDRIRKCSMEGSTFELPEYGKAAALQQRLDEGQWPVIVKVNSEVDVELLFALKIAHEWLPKVVTHVDLLKSLTAFLEPFPVFFSCRLRTKEDGRVANRELVTLQDNCMYNVDNFLSQPEDISAHYAGRSLLIFNEMRTIAQWMCVDPEQRLYKKPSDSLPTRSSTVSSKRFIKSCSVSVQADAQSQAGMQHAGPVDYLGTLANARIRKRYHLYAIHDAYIFSSLRGDMFALSYAAIYLVATSRRR